MDKNMENCEETQFVNPEKMTYREAVNELESILRTMQGDDCDIDRLGSLTRRAASLIGECRRRLVATDDELREILAKLEQ